MEDTQNLLEEIKSLTWRKRGKWHPCVLYEDICNEGESLRNCEAFDLPFGKRHSVWLFDGNYYDSEEDCDRNRKFIREKYAADSSYLLSFGTECLASTEELIVFSESYRAPDATTLSNFELATIFSAVTDKIKDNYRFMLCVHFFDELLTHEFERLLKTYAEENSLDTQKYFEYQTALTLPYRKIYVLEEREQLLELARVVSSNKLDIDSEEVTERIHKHWLKYRWLNFYAYEGIPFAENYFRDKLREILRTDFEATAEQARMSEETLRTQQAEFLVKIGESSELYTIAKAIEMFGFLRSARVDVMNIALCNIWEVVEEIEKRLRLASTDIQYLSRSEIRDALCDSASDIRSLVESRKKGYVAAFINQKRHVLVGNEAALVTDVFKTLTAETGSNATVVKGSTAYPGKISGICRVLHNIGDMHTVERGDILVTSMTDPNYMPAMERAAAFVTDQGGILCHAAIVSREMKKPCVIGTKIATQIFKSGDMIEVDANAGLVRILQKSADQ